MMYLYSGYIYIESTSEQADYEFESEEELDTMGQLQHLLDTGILQIIDSPREELDEDD
jgi:hypothetical protein